MISSLKLHIYLTPMSQTPLLCSKHISSVFVSQKIQLMIPKILFLVEEIRPTTTQIYDLGATVAVLLEACAFEAVESVRDALELLTQISILII